MADHVFINLWKKLNANPQTAPQDSEGTPSPAFIKYLKLVYTPEEAEILQHMGRPVRMMQTQEIADLVGKTHFYSPRPKNAKETPDGPQIDLTEYTDFVKSFELITFWKNSTDICTSSLISR